MFAVARWIAVVAAAIHATAALIASAPGPAGRAARASLRCRDASVASSFPLRSSADQCAGHERDDLGTDGGVVERGAVVVAVPVVREPRDGLHHEAGRDCGVVDRREQPGGATAVEVADQPAEVCTAT